MAIILSDKYPGRSNPPSLDYPQGSIKDQSAPQAKDGTPLKADWANDHEGFFQSLLKEADITANGNVDTAVSSQYFDALKAVISSESQAPSQATESTTGVAKIATQAKVNAGTDDLDFVTPKKLRAGFSISLLANGYIALPTWLGGLVIQWGSITTSASSGVVFTFPIKFPTECFQVVGAPLIYSTVTTCMFFDSNPTDTSVVVSASSVTTSPTRISTTVKIIAIGR